MHYEGGNENVEAILLTAPGLGDRIDAGCGVTVSPVATGEVILHDPEGHRVVYDAIYGCLPSGVLVVALDDSAGSFPDGDETIDVGLVLAPYTAGDAPIVERLTLAAIGTFEPDEAPPGRLDYYFRSGN